MFTAALFKVVNSENEPKRPIMDQWRNKMWYAHNGVVCSFKRMKCCFFVTTWMHLKDIMLRKISQAQKDKYYKISLTCRI
jgi:hypothetical protein